MHWRDDGGEEVIAHAFGKVAPMKAARMGVAEILVAIAHAVAIGIGIRSVVARRAPRRQAEAKLPDIRQGIGVGVGGGSRWSGSSITPPRPAASETVMRTTTSPSVA